MFPILFYVFGFPIRSYGVMLLIGFFFALLLARSRAERFGFDKTKLTDAAFWALVFGILGARIAFIAQELPYYLSHPKELFSIEFAGLTSFGGLLFGAGYFVWWARRQGRSAWDVLDLAAPAAFIGEAIGRVGCLLNGCCYGGVMGHVEPWAFYVGGQPHHPAQAYDTLMDFAALGVFLLIERRGLWQGQGFALFLILDGVARFIFEFWRAGTDAQVDAGIATSTYWGTLPITQAQAVAGAMIIAGGVMLWWFKHKQGAKREAAAA